MYRDLYRDMYRDRGRNRDRDRDLDFISDSSPLGDRTVICHKSKPRHQTCVIVKICVMTSHVHDVCPSERGSAICDCGLRKFRPRLYLAREQHTDNNHYSPE